MSNRLASKIAIVTGSTAGIGAAIARRFAAEGARVLVHGRSEAEAQAVVGQIRAADGTAEYQLADLADPSAPETIVARTVELFGTVDILINNAAWVVRSDIDSIDSAGFDRTIAINTRAPLFMIKAALPYFRAQGSGGVLNIGSINGYCGEKSQLAYAISKGALMTLSRNLADSLGPEGIRVNHFNVGWTLTDNERALKIREGLPEDWESRLPRVFAPSGRLLSPDEIAHYALSFVEDSGGFVSGAVVELEQFPIIGRNPQKETT
jgi:NAD(P)-dependent dehydrogenase (short-subunit alcohol dehydrogenase family)